MEVDLSTSTATTTETDEPTNTTTENAEPITTPETTETNTAATQNAETPATTPEAAETPATTQETPETNAPETTETKTDAEAKESYSVTQYILMTVFGILTAAVLFLYAPVAIDWIRRKFGGKQPKVQQGAQGRPPSQRGIRTPGAPGTPGQAVTRPTPTQLLPNQTPLNAHSTPVIPGTDPRRR